MRTAHMLPHRRGGFPDRDPPWTDPPDRDPPPCEQNDTQVQKHNLPTTSLGAVIIVFSEKKNKKKNRRLDSLNFDTKTTNFSQKKTTCWKKQMPRMTPGLISGSERGKRKG